MGEALITRRGGGGANLNFSVNQYPSSTDLSQIAGKENEIAVLTDNDIKSWQFSHTEPENPKTGMVWIKLAYSSHTDFNALKKNAIILEGAAAFQYLGGDWMPKHALIYQGGRWKDFRYYLFISGGGLPDGRHVVIQTGNGTLTEVQTVPFDNTDSDGTTFVHEDCMYVSNENVGLIFYFPERVDVTDYSTLHVELEQTGAFSASNSKWVVGVGPDTPSDWSAYGTWAAKLNYKRSPTGRGVATVDISSVTGQQYIKVGPINYNYAAPIGYCYNVWLE